MENQVVELERQISQGLKNRQAIIENLERQFEFLKNKNLCTESLPRTTNTKPRHKFVYRPPSIRNENDKVHILYTNAKTFADDVLPNRVGDKKLKSMDGVGDEVLTKKEIEKADMGLP
uniref:Uncharacterized protein n=1 Tax=Tanacetum cinerariifolium TaxID=118510 RepID=A0A699HF96_TANCI|nr:hypothetical protein [Tanacetum cinerariifolium]